MQSALTPREIQARLRGGATVDEVAEEAGVEAVEIEGFAGPVLAEREFLATTALQSTIRRSGENTHRTLGELVTERLRQRRIDADRIVWDAWRQADMRWRIVGDLQHETAERRAEFVFDQKGRYSVAHNADARWMIGEEVQGASSEDENTVDLNDELALVRATREEPVPAPAGAPGDDVPDADAMHDDNEDTSSLDELYDMLSGVSEDSVRIYVGLDEEESPSEPAGDDSPAADPAPKNDEEPDPAPAETPVDDEPVDPVPDAVEGSDDWPTDVTPEQTLTEPVQDSLVEDPSGEPVPRKPQPRKRRGRAHVPSWDEIMFGGPKKQ